MFPIANFHFLFQFWFKQYFVFINTVLILIIYQKLGGGAWLGAWSSETCTAASPSPYRRFRDSSPVYPTISCPDEEATTQERETKWRQCSELGDQSISHTVMSLAQTQAAFQVGACFFFPWFYGVPTRAQGELPGPYTFRCRVTQALYMLQ